MFEGLKNMAFNWAVKQRLNVDQQFLNLLQDRLPRWNKWTTEAAVSEGYKASIWVYAAINKKARAAASVPWYVYKRGANGEWQKQEAHPLQTLIDKPNPFTSRNNMIERLIMQLELSGNSYYKASVLGGVPVELWNIGPDGMRAVPDSREFILNYEYTTKDGKKSTFPAEEVFHFMYIDPSNPFQGVAPLQVAARTVDTDVEAVNWNKVALQNRAVTDGVFSVQQPLNDAQFRELRQQVKEQHQGSQNARAPWVLGAGAEWHQMSLSPADMDFIEGRKLGREEIAAIFQVPPPLIGILDKANYSNMKEARRVFWLDTIIPLLDDLKETFNRGLTPYFGDDIVLDYDTANVEALAENVNEKITGAKDLFAMGIPFNAINQRLDLGFDEIEGGDIGYLPGGLMPASMAAAVAAAANETDPAPDPEATEPEDVPAGATEGEEQQKAKKLHGRFELKAFNLKTPEQKAAYWKAFERQRAAWYVKFQRETQEIFRAEAKAVSKAFAESGGDLQKTLAAIDRDAWETMYKKNYMAIFEQFGQATLDGFKSHFPQVTKEWDPWTNTILGRIFSFAAQKVTHVTDYTKELIKGLVYTGRENGDSIATIARDINKGFDEFSTHRSFRIARTEVVSASNFGSFHAAQEAAEEVGDLEKEWIDSKDKRVRDRHSEEKGVGGEIVGLYKKFSNNLEYPGDMNGPASEVIHCRCTLAYTPKAYKN